jgi:hypothetical protein
MKNLPRELQEKIASSLDAKSLARVRAASKNLKEAVDTVTPPTGSYQKKMGRFQKRFSDKGMYSCIHKIDDSIRDSGISVHDLSPSEMYSTGRMMWRVFKKSYRKNTLLEHFRHILREKTFDDFVADIQAVFGPDLINRNTREDLRRDWKDEKKHFKDYRRRVIRLIKAWAKTDPRYTETVAVVRRRTKPFTVKEERMHKDRLMDAIIVQTLVISMSDDPTKPIPKQNGTMMTLQEKIDRLVKKCSTRHVEQKK